MARFKKEATLCLDQGDREGAARWLQQARQVLADVPATPETQREAAALALIEEHLATGALDKFQKHAKYQAYRRQVTRPYPDA
jgi:hypothetical protein